LVILGRPSLADIAVSLGAIHLDNLVWDRSSSELLSNLGCHMSSMRLEDRAQHFLEQAFNFFRDVTWATNPMMAATMDLNTRHGVCKLLDTEMDILDILSWPQS
jgi:hypothetical protein